MPPKNTNEDYSESDNIEKMISDQADEVMKLD